MADEERSVRCLGLRTRLLVTRLSVHSFPAANQHQSCAFCLLLLCCLPQVEGNCPSAMLARPPSCLVVDPHRR